MTCICAALPALHRAWTQLAEECESRTVQFPAFDLRKHVDRLFPFRKTTFNESISTNPILEFIYLHECKHVDSEKIEHKRTFQSKP
jgi:hypothetical protein